MALGLRSLWTVDAVKVQTTTAGHGIVVITKSLLRLGAVEFGAVAAGYTQFYVATNSVVEPASNYTISGGGGYHIYCEYGGTIYFGSGRTITLTGTPAFSGAFVVALNGGSIRAPGITFTGGATGKRALVEMNGVIAETGTAIGGTYFPGTLRARPQPAASSTEVQESESLFYNPRNWFWIVGGDETKAWSSASGSYVSDYPKDRVARIATEAEMTDFLRPYGLLLPAPVELDYAAAIQAEIDAAAKAKGYASGFALAGYATSTVPDWAAEAAAFIAWRDQIWLYAYSELAKVQGGQRQKPRVAEMTSELPAIEWPK